MEQLHQDFVRQHHDLIMHTHDQIRTLLTPEQQQKFDRDFPIRASITNIITTTTRSGRTHLVEDLLRFG